MCRCSLSKEQKSHYCCLRMFWSTVWPGVKTFGTVSLQEKKTEKPLCPALKCQLSRWIVWPRRLRGVFGSLHVEVQRLSSGQVCGYISGVVTSTGVSASWLPPSSESHCIMRLKYQKWDKQTVKRQMFCTESVGSIFNIWLVEVKVVVIVWNKKYLSTFIYPK